MIRFRQAPDGRLLEVEARIVTLTGIPLERWLASADAFWSLVHEEDRAALREALRGGHEDTRPVCRAFRVRHPATGRVSWWQEWRRHGGEVHEGCWLDQTVAWRLYRRLEATQGRDLLADMLPGYVHDLNNALTGILSLADLCLLEHSSSPSVEGHLQQLSRNAAAMRRLLEGLTRFHEEQDSARPVEVQWHDLGQLCREATDLARPALASRIQLEVQTPDGPLPVAGERRPLQQALYQLLFNAARAIHGNGTIRVEASETEAPSGACRHGRHACLSVTDTGHGMAPEVAVDAFALTCSTVGGKEGIGAGLHFLRRTVERMGGAVAIQSTPQGGTTVSCFFPLASDSEEEKRPESSLEGSPLLAGRLVLVDLAGDGAGRLVERLRNGPWTLMRLAGGPERAVAGGDVNDRGLVVWGGELTPLTRWHLELLHRQRPRRSVFLVVAPTAGELDPDITAKVDEVAALGAPDLMERVVRWREAD